jgi:hypothetical protein
MWEWIVSSIVDDKSPLFISKEVFINIATAALGGVISALLIAPMTARFVAHRQRKDWETARKHFLSRVRDLLLEYILLRAGLFEQAAEYLGEPQYDNHEEFLEYTERDMLEMQERCARILHNVEREFDLAAPILSPRSHSLFSKVRDQIHHLSLYEFVETDVEQLKLRREGEARLRAENPDLVVERPMVKLGPLQISSDAQLAAVDEYYATKGLQAPLMLVVLWRMAILDGIKPTCTPAEMFRSSMPMYKDVETTLVRYSTWQQEVCSPRYVPKQKVEIHAKLLKAYLCAAYTKAEIARVRFYGRTENMLWNDFQMYQHEKSITDYKIASGELKPQLPPEDPSLLPPVKPQRPVE